MRRWWWRWWLNLCRFIAICRIDGVDGIRRRVVDCQQNAEREVMDDYVSAELVYHKIKLFFLAVTGARTVECRISVHVPIHSAWEE